MRGLAVGAVACSKLDIYRPVEVGNRYDLPLLFLGVTSKTTRVEKQPCKLTNHKSATCKDEWIYA